jgi:propionyl-CoA carboxylase alpha chain/3-methylcrotonyl-CoA carboxylase alpha subunit/acetyl-CoA/propionyl-CoA carboxylase biotin carboxyl carrier protein
MSQIQGLKKVLIANRGEIAVRIARTLARLEIGSALVAHLEDATSPAARAVDELCPIEGPTPVAAYLDGEQAIAAAKRIGADAIHPGYGFLSENADFAASVQAAGLRWIGPSPKSMRLLGDKIESRRFVGSLDVPLTPSASQADDPASFLARAKTLGFPLLIKASAGGGGKGMQVVRDAAALPQAIEMARSAAARYFKDDRIYAERYVESPRHIEVQILADTHGQVFHLGERDCSIQRRFQKLVEETPAPGLTPALRHAICDSAVRIARAADYHSAGTVEFILDPSGDFYFLEMNTRLQVEHPVTELVTGIDLVEQQLRVAAGEKLALHQDSIVPSGVAIECRLCAEDPDHDFRPAVGELLVFRPAEGKGIRFDGGIEKGQKITTAFDPMLAKLVVHASDRTDAIDLAIRALSQTVVLGCTTNASFLARVLDHPEFRAGHVQTGFIPAHAEDLAKQPLPDEERRMVLAAAALADRDFRERVAAVPTLHASIGTWRN